jgi:glycosyltransferase involved in cell wall biosynthesis
MKTSVALTTYNGEKYILEQLRSIHHQSIQPEEIVISDDNSTDGTLKIINEFKKNTNITIKIILNRRNIGYTKNFDKVLHACSGDFVFLCDQDDVWYENKIERMLNAFGANKGIDLLIHDLDFCDSNLKPIGQTKLERLTIAGFSWDRMVVGMATAVRKDFLKKVLPIPAELQWTHDTWLHENAKRNNSRMILTEPLASYRRHESNTTKFLFINMPSFLSKTDAIKHIENNNRKNVSKNIVTKGLEKNLNRNIALSKYCPFLKNLEKVEIDKKIHLYKTRLDILNTRGVSRLVKILRNLLQKGYSIFGGAQIAIRDLFFYFK